MSNGAPRKKRLVIYTVGTTPEPIVASLEALASCELLDGGLVDTSVRASVDTYVVFVASPETRGTFEMARDAARRAGASILNFDEPITVDPYDFRRIRTVILEELPRVAVDITRYDEIVADLTGGTKAMAGALASVALALLRPGSAQDVYLSYVQVVTDAEAGVARSLPPRLTRLDLDGFVLAEVVTALHKGDVDKAFQAAEYLSPHNTFHEWLRMATRLQKALTSFNIREAGELARELDRLVNNKMRDIENDIAAIEDSETREISAHLYRSYSERRDVVRKLAEAYRHLQKAQRGAPESMRKQADWLAENARAARLVPLHFLAEAVWRRIRGDLPMAVTLLYRTIESALQVEFIVREKRSLWDFDAMKRDYPAIVMDDSVTLRQLQTLMAEKHADAARALEIVEDALPKLRDMRNFGVLAHGYNDSGYGDPRAVDEIAARVFRFVAILCYRGKKADACASFERLTPFYPENPEWKPLRDRLVGVSPTDHAS